MNAAPATTGSPATAAIGPTNGGCGEGRLIKFLKADSSVSQVPGIVSSFTTNTFAPNTTISARTSRLNSLNQLVADQELRGGLSVDVPVTSSQPTVGTILTSPLTFTGGGGTRSTLFDPQTVGTSILTIPSPVPGFSAPTTLQAVTANVRAPEVRIGAANITTQRIGRDLQITLQVTLENAPPQPVDVIVTVAAGGEGITAVTKTVTAVGTNTVSYTGVTSTLAGSLTIQGLALGSTHITAIAAGYNDSTATVSVEPSGFYVLGPSGLTTVNTTVGAANTALTVHSAALDPTTLNLRADQELRGGLTVNVPVTSSNTVVGTITISPVVLTGGGGSQKPSAFDPASVGTAVVTIPTPVPGFSTVSNFSTGVTINVAP